MQRARQYAVMHCSRGLRQSCIMLQPTHYIHSGLLVSFRVVPVSPIQVDKDFTLSVQPHNGMDVSRNDKDTDPCSI